MSSPADHNLLFGILALQMDFITREQLVAAMNAWVLEKMTPLGTVLVRQNALQPDEHQLLEALVAKHLSKHSNDPEKSLAAVPAASAIRADLFAVADPEVQASLVHLQATQVEDDPLQTVPPTLPPSDASTLWGRRFRFLRKHARGGLGEVCVAMDGELRREVALKQILPQYADQSDSRSRFMVEAEITGGLEHPGIVPVYGFGVKADGRPYYAMRFIRGYSLKDAIATFHSRGRGPRDSSERSQQLQELLIRFIAMCNTLEYAHSRGVLHRDIKPDNVMLGGFGETLVVDWGLAKPLGRIDPVTTITDQKPLVPSSGSNSPPTQGGSLIGTPQYMSPEQANGEIEQLGPASDIYSLGATLYQILVGQNAFQDRNLESIISKVRCGDFAPPRRVSPRLPRPLEAIVLKAMALRPSDRYLTAFALADDLKKWMADAPVSAYRERWHERLRRFARRHRAWTQAAAVALIVIALVAVMAGALINSARRREVLAHAASERSFQAARQTVDDFLTHVSESKLLDVPGLHPLRRELLEQAARYYHGFVEQHESDPAVRLELANAHYRLGLIELQIGTTAESLATLQAALATARTLESREPAGHDLTETLANIHNATGNVYQITNRLAQAQTSFAAAKLLREKLLRDQPDNPLFRRKLANSINNLAAVEALEGKTSAALSGFASANALREALCNENPSVPRYLRDSAQGYFNQGIVLRDVGKPVQATEDLRKALDAYRRLADLDRKAIDNRRELAVTGRVLADVLTDLAQVDEAIKLCDEAGRMADELARKNPFLLGLQADAAAVYVCRGRIERGAARLEPALEWLQKARAIQERLVEFDRDEQRFSADLAGSLLQIGWVRLDGGEFGQARESFSAALAILERLLAEQPNSIEVVLSLAKAHTDLGLVERNEQKPAAALPHFQEELRLYQELARVRPRRSQFLFGQADALLNIAVEQRSLNQIQEALSTTDKANALQVELTAGFPGIPDYQILAGEIQCLAGRLRFEQGNPEAALPFYEASRKLRQAAVATQPDNWELQSALGATLDDMAVVCARLQRDAEAYQLVCAATPLLRLAVEHAPAVAKYRRFLTENLAHRFAADFDAGHYSAAVQLIHERQSLWPNDAAQLYEVAAEWAIVAAALMAGEGKPSPETRSAVLQYRKEAIAALGAARAAGFSDFDRLRADADFASLHDLPEFQAMLPAAAKKP